MRFSTFFTILAIIGVLYALAFLIAPAEAAKNYSIHLDAGGVVVARLFAAALGALSVLSWLLRNQDPAGDVARSAMWASLLYNFVTLVVAVIAIQQGVANSLGWSTVVLTAFILVGLFFFLSKKKAII